MRKLGAGAVLLMLSVASGWVGAEESAESPATAEESVKLPTQDQIYGFELMTKDERKQYREQYEAIKSDAERQTFLENHRKLMQERARALGFGTPEQAHAMAKDGLLKKDEDQTPRPKSNEGGIHNYLHY